MTFFLVIYTKKNSIYTYVVAISTYFTYLAKIYDDLF